MAGTRGIGPIAAFVVGLGVLQALWILTLPPFAATDEFEHAYRAAGVAGGEFRLDTAASDRRGELTEVPESLVSAASAQCDALRYTGPDTCFGAGNLGDGRVVVATAAGSYNPAFYFVVGTISKPFSGAGALYAMRAAAAMLCLALIAAAAWLQRRRGQWTRLGLVVSLTPTLVYTTAVGAPNGAEIAAGILLWVALLELASEDPPEHELAALWLAVLAACLLVTLRLLGPLFLVLILGVAGVVGFERGWRRARRYPVHFLTGTAVVLVAGGLSVAWILGVGQLSGGQSGGATPGDSSASGSVDAASWGASNVVLWLFQAVAAFPFRNNLVPLPVYAMMGTLVVTFVALAFLEGRSRLRIALALALVLTLLTPVLLTALTFSSQGDVWQGRYVLPLGVGFVLLAGRAIDSSRPRTAPMWVVAVIGAVLAVSITVGLLMVRDDELADVVSSADPSWWAPPTALVVVGVLIAVLLLVISAAGGRKSTSSTTCAGESSG